MQVFLDKVYHLAAGSVPPLGGELKGGLSFTLSLLVKTGNVSDLLGSFLEEQLALLPDPNTAMVVLKSLVSVKGTRKQMTTGEIKDNAYTLGKQIKDTKLLEMLQTFIHLRILRDKDQSERYELRHDALATKIFEKISLVEKEMLEVRQFIENGYSNWQKRKVLMSADDLDYIAPYQSRLFLPDEQKEFIEKSRNELLRKKHRKRNMVTALGIFIILVLSTFTIWALKERNRAQLAKTKALAEKYNSMAKNVAVDYPAKGLQVAEYAFSLDSANKTIHDNVRRIYYDNNLNSLIAEHDAPVRAVAFSPNRKEVLTAATNGTVKLSDRNGNLIRIFIGPARRITNTAGNNAAVVFSPDGKIILTSPADTVARLWNREGNIIADLKGHTGLIGSAVFSSDGKSILTGSDDGTARLWDLEGNTKKIFNGHNDDVRTAVFSSDDRYILTGSWDHSAILWDTSGSIIRKFECPFMVWSADISQDGKHIITSGNYAIKLDERLIKLYPANINHYMELLKAYLYHFKLNPIDDPKEKIESINQSVLSFTSKDDLVLAAYYYLKQCYSIDSTNNHLQIVGCYLELCDKIMNSPGIENERMEDIGR